MAAVIEEVYAYRRVDENLHTSGQPTDAQLASIAQAGFQVVINLALHDDPRYSLPDETGLVTSLGMTYIHIPVAFDQPREQDLLAFFDAMDAHQDKKRWVHCAANMRVSAFLGLYDVIRRRQPEEEAFALMRSVWEPNSVWDAFIRVALAPVRRAACGVAGSK